MLAVSMVATQLHCMNYRLGNVMFSSDTFKPVCFPLAPMSMPSNTRGRVSNVLTSTAGFRIFMDFLMNCIIIYYVPATTM